MADTYNETCLALIRIHDIVYSEVILGYLRAQTQLSSKRIREKLQSLNVEFDDLHDLFSLFITLPSHSGSNIFQVMNSYHLMPHEALITSSCQQYGLDKIVTADSDFSRVDFLEIINPQLINLNNPLGLPLWELKATYNQKILCSRLLHNYLNERSGKADVYPDDFD